MPFLATAVTTKHLRGSFGRKHWEPLMEKKGLNPSSPAVSKAAFSPHRQGALLQVTPVTSAPGMNIKLLSISCSTISFRIDRGIAAFLPSKSDHDTISVLSTVWVFQIHSVCRSLRDCDKKNIFVLGSGLHILMYRQATKLHMQ